MSIDLLTGEARRPKFTDVFVERPVLAVVIALTLLLVGLRAALAMPVLQYPRIESSSLEITTPYVGASAETVQGFITDLVERAASTIPGIDYIESRTVPGLSTVTVYLQLNEDSTDALAELSTRLGQIRFELPEGAEDPSVEVRRADRPQAGWYLDVILDDGLSRAEVTDYLTRRVNPILSSIPGVQRVTLEGGLEPAMRVWLDPARMEAFDVSASELRAAIARNNTIATIGRSENEAQRIELRVNTNLETAEEFEQLVIRNEGGALIRLGDVARVELGAVEASATARATQQDTIYIAVWPLPGANEIEIADRMYEVLEDINPTLPAGLEVVVGFDVTTYMRDALREIGITLIETVLLVGLVVVALMGSVRTALVPLVTIPISLLGAVAAMALMGFSLNLLTVLAIVLSVGLVVDDAIVVVENVARYMREGMGRREAALASSRQLLAPIIAMTLTLAAVYAPIGFLTGLTGVLFKEFAFTLAVAVLISGIVALTLSPIMSAWVSPEGGREGRLTRLVNTQFERTALLYRAALDRLLRANGKVIFVAAWVTMLAVPFFLFSQKELAPTEDQSSINVIFSAAPESTLDYTTEHMQDVVDAMLGLPGAEYMWQIVRPSGGFSGMEFVPHGERELSVHEMLPMAFGATSGVVGLEAFPILPSALPTAGNFDVELVVMSGDEPIDMLPYARELVDAAMATGMFLYADTDLRIDLPQGRLVLDRDRVADLGLDLAEVGRQLSVYLSTNFVNRFDLDGRAYRVIPGLEDAERPDPGAVLDLKLRTPAGDLVPVSAVATLEREVGPRVLSKFQQNNAFRVTGAVVPGVTKGQALTALEDAAREILPGTYTLDHAGESRQLRKEGNTLVGVLCISLAFVFLCLSVQFDSFRDPLVVLAGSVPLALSSAMLLTFLGWTTINIYSQVGFITLVGLVSKNAILIVEFARQLQEEGADKLRAIKEAAETRLRPVLMTTGATVMGHFPLVLVTGAGAEARNSIGIVLVGGMLIGTVFTLFVLPSLYMLFASTHRAAGGVLEVGGDAAPTATSEANASA
ncbi:MAG: efflux RND transporter permease subunit [Pseudomonadales bacterium]|jgi:multidrug efflux pump|nr:efflux RND transporter permease subunit [Pseudomonadales bacterium]